MIFYFACAIQSHSFFGFPPWWKYIKNTETDPATGTCVPRFSFPNDIWSVGFAVIDMLLYLAGIVAVLSIIVSGIMYITSLGNTEKTTAARRRIVNSLIGLAIVLTASLLVSFIGSRIG